MLTQRVMLYRGGSSCYLFDLRFLFVAGSNRFGALDANRTGENAFALPSQMGVLAV